MIKYAFNSWLNGYKKIFCYTGRERRSAFGLFIVIQFLLFIIISSSLENIDLQSDDIYKPILLGFYIIIFFLAMLSYNVRRLHDANLSGWLCFFYLGFIGLTILVSIFLPPVTDYNKYGLDPRIAFKKKDNVNLIVN